MTARQYKHKPIPYVSPEAGRYSRREVLRRARANGGAIAVVHRPVPAWK